MRGRTMRRITLKFALFSVFSCFAIYFFMRYGFTDDYQDEQKTPRKVHWIKSTTREPGDINRVVLSFVVCDSRFNESLNVVKSALLFTKIAIHLVIFTDDMLRPKMNEILTKWRNITRNQLQFELHMIKFPKTNTNYWLHLFKKCAAQRLFFPNLLHHIDAMIYVDTDTLFLGPVEKLWNEFTKFNDSQIAALALEDDNPNVSWYPRFAKHPFYGKYGLNSGVMLMNLTRMRSFSWVDYITPIMVKWKANIAWGDQDIINIIFSYHGRSVFVLSCRYNYRSDQCQYGDACADATSKGIFVLHGSRKSFFKDKQPAFRAVYEAIDEHDLGTDPSSTLLANLDRYISQAPPSNCGNLKDAFLRVPTETFKTMYSRPNR